MGKVRVHQCWTLVSANRQTNGACASLATASPLFRHLVSSSRSSVKAWVPRLECYRMATVAMYPENYIVRLTKLLLCLFVVLRMPCYLAGLYAKDWDMLLARETQVRHLTAPRWLAQGNIGLDWNWNTQNERTRHRYEWLNCFKGMHCKLAASARIAGRHKFFCGYKFAIIGVDFCMR